MRKVRNELYGTLKIEANEVPEAQFDFGRGIGWAYRITNSDDTLAFRVIVKSFDADRTEDSREFLYNAGIRKIHSIASQDRNQAEYCFILESESNLEEIDCNTISPRSFRSPLR